MCKYILFSTLQEPQASAVMVFGWRVVLGGVDGQPLSDSALGEGREEAEVLAQSAHHLLSGGGRGLYYFHTSLSLSIT